MTIKPRPPTPSESTFIADTLLAARLYRPYYARAIAALTPLVVEGLGTVAVSNRWHIYMDLDWLRSLPERVRAAVIAAHEIEHLLRKHGKRQEDSGLPPSTGIWKSMTTWTPATCRPAARSPATLASRMAYSPRNTFW
jgi:hypothetical protein